MDQNLRFSFIIANYNYERFLSQAISSALAVRWDDVEVIVVDDGSTDNSRAIIGRFGEQITSIFTENRGQRHANNIGFEASSGDVITFLDADDIVEPEYAEEVAAAWQPGVSKVQVLMSLVDAENNPMGGYIPRIAKCPSSEQIRNWALSSSEYPTPPGSGNAYSREFLLRLFPIGSEHDYATDSTCLALAPLLGDVKTVMKPLVRYRQHGANDSNMFIQKDGFRKEVDRASARQTSLETACTALGITPPPRSTLRYSLHLLQLRAASIRLSAVAHPDPADTRLRIVSDAARTLFCDSYHSLSRRIGIAAWIIATLVLPKGAASSLVAWRFQF